MRLEPTPCRGRVAACDRASPARPPAETTLTIATVNNGDMVRMQRHDRRLHQGQPGHQAAVGHARGERAAPEGGRPDIATKGGQFDVLTIGTYEVSIWAKKGWLVAARQSRRRLQRRRPAAGDPRRPRPMASSMRVAVLRRVELSSCIARTSWTRPG